MRLKKGNSLLIYFFRAFFMIIVIPLIIINLLLNNQYKKILIQNYSENIMKIMEQIAVTYENEQTKMALLVSQVANDKELLALLTMYANEGNYSKVFDLQNEIDAIIKYIVHSDKDIETFVVYFENGKKYYYGNPPMVSDAIVRRQEWFRKAQTDVNQVQRIEFTEGITHGIGNTYRIASAVTPSPSVYKHSIEVIYIESDTKAFSPLNSKFSNNEFGSLSFIGSKGEVFVTTDAALPKQIKDDDSLFQTYYAKKNQFVQERPKTGEYISAYFLEKSQTMIINIVNKSMLLKDINGIRNLINLMYLVIFGLFLLFGILSLQEIIVPIRNLVHKMKRVQHDDFQDFIDVSGPAEIRRLSETYNTMIREIKELMIERDRIEMERSQEEMRALQAQINPHFVYNTMNTIRLMAMMSKADHIKNMIDAFMRILSKTFKDVGKRGSVKEEIDYLKNYLYIMQVRYGSGIEFVVNISEEIQQLFIMNMLLQPIVENSVIHGFRDRKGDNEIVIEGYLEEHRLILVVKDNGCGMTQEGIKELFDRKNKKDIGFNQVGIANVDQRIKLNYGNEYGLVIESTVDVETIVHICLPIFYE